MELHNSEQQKRERLKILHVMDQKRGQILLFPKYRGDDSTWVGSIHGWVGQ